MSVRSCRSLMGHCVRPGQPPQNPVADCANPRRCAPERGAGPPMMVPPAADSAHRRAPALLHEGLIVLAIRPAAREYDTRCLTIIVHGLIHKHTVVICIESEQKNGAVVRHVVGYRRLEGLEAATALARLYATVRLFANFFQPSFKLAEKERDGARVRKRYHRPATPCQRLLADPRTSQEVRDRVTALYADVDPVRLLSDMRTAQQQLVDIAERSQDESM